MNDNNNLNKKEFLVFAVKLDRRYRSLVLSNYFPTEGRRLSLLREMVF